MAQRVAERGMEDGEQRPSDRWVEVGKGAEWKDPKKAAEALRPLGSGLTRFTPLELISPAQVEGLLGKEKFAELMSDVKGARPTLAPEIGAGR